MKRQPENTQFSMELRDRVLERFGFSSPPPINLEGLGALYHAWCMNIPFDNVRKMIALHSAGNRLLPDGHADDFSENWLNDGVGGTCWPTSNALFELTRSLGFDATRISGCMRDMGITNHASVRVQLDEQDWLVDSSLLYDIPIPLGEEVVIQSDPVFGVEVEPADGTFVVWADFPPNPVPLPCRILPGDVTPDFYLAGYEASRERSPFNQRLYVRRNYPGRLLVLWGRTQFSKTSDGLISHELSRDELLQILLTDIGLSCRTVEEWVQSGSLEASFEPPVEPSPPPVTTKPPSRRG